MSAFPLIYPNPPLLLRVCLLSSTPRKSKPTCRVSSQDPSCSPSRAASFISRQRADPGGGGVGGEESTTALGGTSPPPHNRDQVAQRAGARQRRQKRDGGPSPGAVAVGRTSELLAAFLLAREALGTPLECTVGGGGHKPPSQTRRGLRVSGLFY